MSLNDTIIGVRAQLLRAGAAAPLGWWTGQPFAQHAILKRLFPATADQAAGEIVGHAARQLGMQGLPDALTLFDLGETRETLLRAHQAPAAEPPAVNDGRALGEALLTAFPALTPADPRVGTLTWRENRVLGRVETELADLHDPLSDEDTRLVLQVLLSGLRFSSPGEYLQPVIVRAG